MKYIFIIALGLVLNELIGWLLRDKKDHKQ